VRAHAKRPTSFPATVGQPRCVIASAKRIIGLAYIVLHKNKYMNINMKQ